MALSIGGLSYRLTNQPAPRLHGSKLGQYQDDVVTYNLLGANCNTFTAYMLRQAWMGVPERLSLWLLTNAPGWFAAMAPNP